MRFLKTFFRFCTITILCTTFTTVAWGYAWENLSTSPNCNPNTVLDCVAVTGCAYYPVANKCGESLCSNGTKAACNKKAGCIWMEQNCQVVPDGYFSPDGDKTLNGNTYDRAHHYGCPAGYYCKAGSGWPIICSAGTYSGANASSCTNCPAGTYRSSTGGTSASSCSNCAPGEYSNPGATQCTKCPVGYYQNAGGQRQCNQCPDGTTTKNTGSTDSSQCIKKFNLKLYAEYQENGTTKQTLVSDSTHSFYAGDLNLFSGYSAQQIIGGKLGSAPLNNKWEYKPNTDKAYITVNGTNYNLAYNGTNWFWKNTSDMSILDAQAGDSTFNLVFILTPKTYNVYMLSASTNSGSSVVGYDQPTKDIVVDTEAIANKNFGAALSAVTPNTEKVQTCAIILGYGGLGGTTTYSYGYIADTATPTYYECTIDGNEATIYLGNNYKKTTIFEPSVYGRHICVGYVHTTCEAGYSCNSCDRTACTTGTYQDATGQSSCKNCSAGSATNGSTTSCTPCGVGTYSSGTANASCTACAKGKYQNKTGKSSCDECAVNTYQDETGKSSCKSCSTQTSSKYPSSAKGSDAISDCYLTLAAANGTYVPTTSGGEKPCPAGYYCLNGGTTVYYSSPNTPTTVAANGQCAKGEYSTGGASQCLPCQEGSKTGVNGPGATSCTPCSAGTYSAQTSNWQCQPCAAGKYSEESGQAYCDTCPAGTYSEGSASSCTPCEAGKYSAEGASSCSPCGPGYKTDGSPTSCTPCDAGTYSSNTTNTNCSPCPTGTYQDKTGQSSCNNCGAGKNTGVSGTGATSCTDCDAGTFSKDTANANCSPCPAGTYQNETGKSSCRSCEDGTTKVTSSPNGIFTTTEGAITRNQCCFKSSLTLTDALGDLEEQNFSNVCWVGNGRIR